MRLVGKSEFSLRDKYFWRTCHRYIYSSIGCILRSVHSEEITSWRAPKKSGKSFGKLSIRGWCLLECLLLTRISFWMNARWPSQSLPVELPFMDVATDSGYYINIAYQACYSFVGILGVIGIELMNCMLENNINAAKVSIIYSLDIHPGSSQRCWGKTPRPRCRRCWSLKMCWRKYWIWIDSSSNWAIYNTGSFSYNRYYSRMAFRHHSFVVNEIVLNVKVHSFA